MNTYYDGPDPFPDVLPTKPTHERMEYEKFRDDLSYKYSATIPSHRNCWSCCDSDSKHELAFQAGFDSARDHYAGVIESLKRQNEVMKEAMQMMNYEGQMMRTNSLASIYDKALLDISKAECAALEPKSEVDNDK